MRENPDARRLPPRAVIYSTDFSNYARGAGDYSSMLASHFAVDLLICHAFYLSQTALEAEVTCPWGACNENPLRQNSRRR